MLLPENLRKEYKDLGYGTLTDLARSIGIKSTAHASRIMAGKQATTYARVAKIKKFLTQRKSKIKDLHDDGN